MGLEQCLWHRDEHSEIFVRFRNDATTPLLVDFFVRGSVVWLHFVAIRVPHSIPIVCKIGVVFSIIKYVHEMVHVIQCYVLTLAFCQACRMPQEGLFLPTGKALHPPLHIDRHTCPAGSHFLLFGSGWGSSCVCLQTSSWLLKARAPRCQKLEWYWTSLLKTIRAAAWAVQGLRRQVHCTSHSRPYAKSQSRITYRTAPARAAGRVSEVFEAVW